MNGVVVDILGIGIGFTLISFLIAIHIAAVRERRSLERRCKMYQEWFALAKKEDQE